LILEECGVFNTPINEIGEVLIDGIVAVQHTLQGGQRIGDLGCGFNRQHFPGCPKKNQEPGAFLLPADKRKIDIFSSAPRFADGAKLAGLDDLHGDSYAHDEASSGS
jgi:hypothetical protein